MDKQQLDYREQRRDESSERYGALITRVINAYCLPAEEREQHAGLLRRLEAEAAEARAAMFERPDDFLTSHFGTIREVAERWAAIWQQAPSR